MVSRSKSHRAGSWGQAVRQRQGLHREAVDACGGTWQMGYGVVVKKRKWMGDHLGNSWNICGVYMVFIWCLYMFTWCLYGVYMVFMVFIWCLYMFTWCLYGIYMVFIYVYMVFIWCSYDVYMVFIYVYMVFRWCSYDVYMVYIWFIYINMIYKCVIIPCIKLYNGESNGTHGFHWLMNDIMGI